MLRYILLLLAVLLFVLTGVGYVQGWVHSSAAIWFAGISFFCMVLITAPERRK